MSAKHNYGNEKSSFTSESLALILLLEMFFLPKNVCWMLNLTLSQWDQNSVRILDLIPTIS